MIIKYKKQPMKILMNKLEEHDETLEKDEMQIRTFFLFT